jgi:tRNA-dihydrouridine synthase 4
MYQQYYEGNPYGSLAQADLAEYETLRPDQLLRDFQGVNVAAPMVRYSKLPARYIFARHSVHVRR